MTAPGPAGAHVTVVGGGISGLTAAYRLRRALGPAAQITIVEAEGRLGGVLRTVDLAGRAVDVGAEAFVSRRPEVPELLAELGLADRVVRPGGLAPLIRVAGRGHRLPAGTLMGLPTGPDGLGGLIDRAAAVQLRGEPGRPLDWNVGDDPAIGDLVADRFGDQIVDRLLDPLLGGVYAGPARGIGLRAALPALAARLDAGATSLTAAVRAARPPASTEPVFGALRGGYRELVDALAAATDAHIVSGTAVTGLRRAGGRWQVDPVGQTDAVVLAVPAPVAARLLHGPAPAAAAAAAQIPVAAVAVVALAIAEPELLPAASGVLQAGERADLAAKAATFTSRKWPGHLGPESGDGTAVLRLSYGRHGGPAVPGSGDRELAAVAAADLDRLLGRPATVTATVVQRWEHGPVQYRPGHGAVAERVRRSVADLPGLAVAGAFLDGVGVPACIGAATRAVEGLLATSTEWLTPPG